MISLDGDISRLRLGDDWLAHDHGPAAFLPGHGAFVGTDHGIRFISSDSIGKLNVDPHLRRPCCFLLPLSTERLLWAHPSFGVAPLRVRKQEVEWMDARNDLASFDWVATSPVASLVAIALDHRVILLDELLEPLWSFELRLCAAKASFTDAVNLDPSLKQRLEESGARF